MRRWQPIETAPYRQEVELRVGWRKFPAILYPDISLNERDESCAQWHATTDKHPPCWTDGACWESNANEQMSLQPEAWRPIEGADSR